MSQPLIRTSDLCRHYKSGPQQVRAVDHVSINVDGGELVGILGSSGSGKSTLLNLIAGLDTPTSGEIFVEDRSLATMSRKERSGYRAHTVGIVFQSFNLVPHRTALTNVELALMFGHSMTTEERRDHAAEMLGKLGLADRLDHYPADLSGGEQQRVAIARALVKNPTVLLADEPTGNLDQTNSRQIAELLKELNAEGLTILLVTHDRPLAESITERIVEMSYGKVVSGGAV